MNPRYTEEVSIKFGRDFLKMHFGKRATIPHGSRVVWMAGVRYVTDQPGCYLIAGVGGLQGIQVTASAAESEAAA